ncbi:MAG: transcriptional regulator [Clostridia bacterium]|nr:transcriptional regulator [Clostridia bacterium]MBQ8235875.1 transcriptional regulator [Clostridia bacterium]MBQ8399302.1 transcriptional regulator [Clostridia bacterium]
MEERYKIFTLFLTSIRRNIHKIQTHEMAKYNLKSHHLSCLHYLYKAKSLTAKQLCDICKEDKANISRALDYLETNGYLICRSSAKKRYNSPFELTEKGRAVGRSLSEKIEKMTAKAEEGLSDEHKAILYESLAKISSNLQNMCSLYQTEGSPE